MPLPPELLDCKEDTDIVGDVDEFIEYIESGKASSHYNERIAARMRDLEEYGQEKQPHATREE